MKDISTEEKRQILMELEMEPTRLVRERHNLSNQTVSHLRWYYGRVPHGGYHKDLVGNAKLPIMVQATALKKQGENSRHIAGLLCLPLEKVNGFWDKL